MTRPTGDEIKDFEVTKQVGTLSDGLGEGKTGLDKISDGLSKASNELSKMNHSSKRPRTEQVS